MSEALKVKLLTDSLFQESIDKEKVAVVDFWAPWCTPCIQFIPTFEDVAEEMQDVAFFKVNVEEHTDRAAELKVVHIPTVMLFKDGELKDWKSGKMSKEELIEFVKGNL